MQIKKDKNTDVFLIYDKTLMTVKSNEDFILDFKPEVKYSKFNFYSKVSIFRYMDIQEEKKLILSINSKTHRSINFIFYKDKLKENGFNSIKSLLEDTDFNKTFKEIIMKENTEHVFNDAKSFLIDL